MEQMTLDDYLSEKYKIVNKIKLIELFAGYGSQALALEYLGVPFDHHLVCEFNQDAIMSYNELHNTNFFATDVTKLKGDDLNIKEPNKYTYLLTYSFPCTDLSRSGKQKGMTKGSGTRSGLLWEVERLLNETQELPQVLVMENVADIIADKNIEDFNEWIKYLESKGYTNNYQILNAKNYGVPQNRDRCFMVSILGNYTYKFKINKQTKKTIKDIIEDQVEKRYYLKKCLNPVMTNNYIQYDNSNKGHKSQAMRLYYLDSLAPTLPFRNHGDKSQIILLTKDQVYKDWDKIKDNLWKYSRRLTAKECFRLMGVKDSDFDKLTVVNGKLYGQAGNSIVVNVLMDIFGQML